MADGLEPEVGFKGDDLTSSEEEGEGRGGGGTRLERLRRLSAR